MSIEIKELKIKAIVAPEASEKGQGVDKSALERMKKEILKECLREVKMMINEQKER